MSSRVQMTLEEQLGLARQLQSEFAPAGSSRQRNAKGRGKGHAGGRGPVSQPFRTGGQASAFGSGRSQVKAAESLARSQSPIKDSRASMQFGQHQASLSSGITRSLAPNTQISNRSVGGLASSRFASYEVAAYATDDPRIGKYSPSGYPGSATPKQQPTREQQADVVLAPTAASNIFATTAADHFYNQDDAELTGVPRKVATDYILMEDEDLMDLDAPTWERFHSTTNIDSTKRPAKRTVHQYLENGLATSRWA
ncbi:MAG: hypothetical protein M1818_003789 [Claussenomyces sp. TS43310]|nr:MAG: hypothetical protein M1818_003789 [Claussenomyces sp. TS43310]